MSLQITFNVQSENLSIILLKIPRVSISRSSIHFEKSYRLSYIFQSLFATEQEEFQVKKPQLCGKCKILQLAFRRLYNTLFCPSWLSLVFISILYLTFWDIIHIFSQQSKWRAKNRCNGRLKWMKTSIQERSVFTTDDGKRMLRIFINFPESKNYTHSVILCNTWQIERVFHLLAMFFFCGI